MTDTILAWVSWLFHINLSIMSWATYGGAVMLTVVDALMIVSLALSVVAIPLSFIKRKS